MFTQKKETCAIAGRSVTLHRYDAVVIGTGCAGLNAADSLYDLGVTSVCILTEGRFMGTSRNTGSDKQTYYKLSLSGEDGDSVRDMAKDLAAGGGVEGGTALAEAAGSVRGFLKLVQLGVPFPTNEYGEYAGYKTDHDPRTRATSCGPLTSKLMTEALERSVQKKQIPILDGLTAFSLVKVEGSVRGILACDRLGALHLIAARAVILATGGPAYLYENSVYPESQTGMTGMALAAGAEGANLSEWQYGLASTKFRWNVSGSYQQVLPRYIAVSPDGTEREFLPEYFESPGCALDMVFLKGYQWPFDAAKVNGSSLVDLLVHHEIFHLGNRVFMDFTKDPMGLEAGIDALSPETAAYLKNCGATMPLPIERLRAMNPGAIELYAAHGIDITKEPLEISVCAQHMNGGLRVDANWRTTLPGLWCAGEAAGTFGVTRPGGSALNSTQVGSFRAARDAAKTLKTTAAPELAVLLTAAESAVATVTRLEAPGKDPAALWNAVRRQMSLCAAHIRDGEAIEELDRLCEEALASFEAEYTGSGPALRDALKTRDMLLTARAVLDAMKTVMTRCGSRGGALVHDADGPLPKGAPADYGYRPETPDTRREVLVTRLTEVGFASEFVPVSPIPDADTWFETVWKTFRENGSM